jgi:hypothetical protein
MFQWFDRLTPPLLVGTFAHPKKRAPPREISKSKSRSNPNINDWNPIFEADLNRLFDLGFLEACLQLDQRITMVYPL